MYWMILNTEGFDGELMSFVVVAGGFYMALPIPSSREWPYCIDQHRTLSKVSPGKTWQSIKA